jgi:hypothetical protein
MNATFPPALLGLTDGQLEILMAADVRATRDLSIRWHEVGCGIGIAIRNFDRTLGATAVARPSFRADVIEPKHAERTEPNHGAQGYGRHHGQRIFPPSVHGGLQRY